MRDKSTTMSLPMLVTEILENDDDIACVSINIVERESQIRSFSATYNDRFIINLAMDNLYHLLSNNNNTGDPTELDYIQICDKALLLKLKEKLFSIVKLIENKNV